MSSVKNIFDVSGRAMAAQMIRLNTVATNLTNVNSFSQTYLGAFGTAPTATGTGAALADGMLYFDSTADILKVYASGSGWQSAGSSVNGTSNRFQFTVSSAGATLTGNDNNGNSLVYDANFIDIFLNGVKMRNGTDVNVSSGSSLVFTNTLQIGDIVDCITYGTFQLANISINDLTDTPTIPDTSNFLTETQIDSKISAIDLTLYATESYVDNQIANAVSGGTIDLSGYVTESELDTELLPYALKTELFSGSYNDLADKPTIPSITGLADETYVDDQVQLETVARQAADTAILNQIGAIVHFSGDYNDLTNKPTIPTVPTNVSDLTNDAGYITTSALPDLSNYALSSAIPDVSTFLSEAEIDQKIINVTGGSVDLSNYYTKAEVDGLITTPFSGNYNDLTNKPTIPAVPTLVSELTNDANYVTGNGLTVALQNYQPTVDLSLYALKTELFDGDYNSLTNTPTIPAPVDVSNFLTETEIDSKIASAVTGGTVDLSDYVTDTELATQLANYQPTVDLTSYYTKTETDALIPSITDFLTETEIVVSIEASETHYWKKYTGRNGLNFGINDYGKSAPYKNIYNHFGLNTDNIIKRIKEKL